LVLIDLDSFCAGPREWDLMQTAPFHERFGWRTDEEHREFVDAYGFDIMTWSGHPVFADHREIAMTLWLCGNPGATTGQLPKSASGWSRSGRGSSRRNWSPFLEPLRPTSNSTPTRATWCCCAVVGIGSKGTPPGASRG
ncbi:hypothetical protein LH612_31015, partial [Klebsiella pneumoniae]|nr:hypothetical protein [Klebsiella pneumoniae]